MERSLQPAQKPKTDKLHGLTVMPAIYLIGFLFSKSLLLLKKSYMMIKKLMDCGCSHNKSSIFKIHRMTSDVPSLRSISIV
jgi:hypothetical protein